MTVSVHQGPTSYSATTLSNVASAIDLLGLDADFVRPGDNVVLKPNWVKEHDERYPGPNQWEHVVTHPSVIEGVICWVAPKVARHRQHHRVRCAADRLVIRDVAQLLPAR
jgi:uncharacterized protein (DUF362 family)